MVLFLLILIGVAVILYRNYQGENVTKYITSQVETLYNRFAPYSFKVVREKAKDLGQEFTAKQYLMQIVILGGFAGIVTYLYFYNLLVSIAYVIIAILAVPYLAFLRCKRIYSEFVFEQIQVYTTNVIMEFATTQSFVKSLEGVRDSGVLEDPVLADVNVMIDMAYENGSIDEAIEYIEKLNTGNVPNHIKTDSKEYLYPHNYPNAYVYQEYLPKKLKGKKYYHPKVTGYEKHIKSYYDFIENMKKKANN